MYYKIESDTIFGVIYGYYDKNRGDIFEFLIETLKTPKHRRGERAYKIIDAFTLYKDPFLYMNVLGMNGAEHYKEISQEEFKKEFDNCLNYMAKMVSC